VSVTEVQQPAGEGQPQRSLPLVRAGTSRAAIILLACVCAFMVVVDSSIVNVALPSIRADLHLSSGGQQWVIDAYLLTLGGLLLLGARLADLWGRRPVLLAGIVVFTLASLAGGLAASGTMLLIARAVQGVGGSILAPSGLSLIIASIPEGQARGKAMSLYAASGSTAATVGVLLGGVLTQEISWRWVMFINVPVGIALFLGAARLLTAAPRGQGRQRLDILGAILVTAGIGALIEGFAEAQRVGWGSSLTLLTIAAAIILLAAFVACEARVSDPLVRLSVFRLPGVVAGNALIGCNGIVLTASTFFISQVLQLGLGFSALGAGLRLAPMAVAISAASLISPPATQKMGTRPVLLTGLVTATAGYTWLGLLGSHPAYTVNILGPLLVIGTGLGLTIMPSSRAAAAGIPPQEAGLASGLFNVSRQIGAAIGIAALVTLAVARTNASSRHGTHAAVAALHGDAAALLACAGICLLALIAALSIRAQSASRTQQAETAS